MPLQPSLLFILSGPAGCGKTTLCEGLLAVYPLLNRVVTSTTRPPRSGEGEGVDYYFFSPQAFKDKIEAGDFYEYAQVHNHTYGTLKSEIREQLARGKDLLLNIDVQGAATFRRASAEDPLLAGRMVSVFIMPPSMEELQQRLRGRASESEESLQLRLKTACAELEQAGYYDYCLPSGERAADFKRIEAIYLAEKMRQRKDGLQ